MSESETTRDESREEQADQAEARPSAEELATDFTKMLDHNIALRDPAMVVLAACQERRELGDLIDEVTQTLTEQGKLPVEPVSALIDTLARHGVVEKSVEVDGKPYAGTLADAINDDSLPEEAIVLEYARTTEAGRIAQGLNSPARRATELFARKPTFKKAFLATLSLCESGMSTKKLGDELDALGLLERDPRTNLPTRYPSTFANMLKDVDAIAWSRERHAWVTTEIGRQVAEQQAAS